MTVRLREANLTRDKAAIVSLTQTYLGAAERSRFDWLYRESPFGPARVWLAFDGIIQTPFGMGALFPRKGYIKGEEVLGCVFGDFCISEHYRSLGPAIQLQRACMDMIKSGEFAFSYDFPSSSMLGIYRYMGLTPNEESIRMVRLLRVDHKVREKVSSPVLAAVLARAADFALALKDRNGDAHDGMDYRIDDKPCSAEYARLAERIGSSLGACVARTPEYLDWRYRRHPWREYEFLTCHREGELQAYCVLTHDEGRMQIADLFGSSDEEVVAGLLRRVVHRARERGDEAVSICVLGTDPRMKLLRKLGFHGRESAPVIGFGTKLTNGSRLLLMQGDRES
jgi:hypothetical protein